MIKKGLLAAGSLATAFALTAGLVVAQVSSPTPTASPTASPSPTSSPSVPSGAPATGMGY